MNTMTWTRRSSSILTKLVSTESVLQVLLRNWSWLKVTRGPAPGAGFPAVTQQAWSTWRILTITLPSVSLLIPQHVQNTAKQWQRCINILTQTVLALPRPVHPPLLVPRDLLQPPTGSSRTERKDSSVKLAGEVMMLVSLLSMALSVTCSRPAVSGLVRLYLPLSEKGLITDSASNRRCSLVGRRAYVGKLLPEHWASKWYFCL